MKVFTGLLATLMALACLRTGQANASWAQNPSGGAEHFPMNSANIYQQPASDKQPFEPDEQESIERLEKTFLNEMIGKELPEAKRFLSEGGSLGPLVVEFKSLCLVYSHLSSSRPVLEIPIKSHIKIIKDTVFIVKMALDYGNLKMYKVSIQKLKDELSILRKSLGMLENRDKPKRPDTFVDLVLDEPMLYRLFFLAMAVKLSSDLIYYIIRKTLASLFGHRSANNQLPSPQNG